jgi:acetyl esterase
MNWKIKLVLLFGKLRKPIAVDGETHVPDLRKKANRAVWLGSFLFDKKLPVKQVTDVNANGVLVRIYKNSNKPNQRVIIYYHGGGFVLYGIFSHDYACRRLSVLNDCIVVSVDYQLAPEHPFPAAHHDSFNALKWVRENIAAYGGNPNDLVVAGDSAGGNLAACMAHRCKQAGIPLKAQILVYPWIDGKLNNPSIDRNASGYLLEKETVFWFRRQYTPNPDDYCNPEVSPKYEQDFTGLAPAFVLTAEFDPLLDDGYLYAEQLKQGGNQVLYREYPGLFHSFFSLPGVHSTAMDSFYHIRDFLADIP